MSDSRRVYRAIKQAVKQLYPTEVTVRQMVKVDAQ
jgi:hypothetical protein